MMSNTLNKRNIAVAAVNTGTTNPKNTLNQKRSTQFSSIGCVSMSLLPPFKCAVLGENATDPRFRAIHQADKLALGVPHPFGLRLPLGGRSRHFEVDPHLADGGAHFRRAPLAGRLPVSTRAGDHLQRGGPRGGGYPPEAHRRRGEVGERERHHPFEDRADD